ncbi:hypothetical protein GIW81_00965 [Hyphomicrobium sp. xq]|uniref:Uncharacterized protein n=1 Tax=Hyphomicrobium album TaxID=2665159 RepID=A0A6I3KF23_9HYPH|nr:hypothetical protein [Hyphomicrobium album]MTD92899.1 hypothetical protein [Hyphomicrobium album]
MTLLVDSDRLHSVSSTLVAHSAMKLVNAMQDDRKEVQIAAAACVFAMLAQKLGVHPGNALDVAQRIIAASVKERTDLRAVQMYVNEELKHG